MRYDNSIGWIIGNETDSGVLDLQIDWEAGEAVVHLKVPGAVQAAPAIAHGGFLAALADHVMGFVAAQQEGRPAVTRQMTVDYLAPTPTLKAITVAARADSVTERAVMVSLEGSVDDSGLVTFKGRGDYARVSTTRRHPAGAEIDYDTLEERFDPSQVFGWLVAALKDAWSPRTMNSPVLVSVEVVDAKPRHWTFKATGTSLAVEPTEPADWDVRFAGTVRAWRELVYGRRTADQLMAAGSAVVEDPDGLLPSFLRSLATDADQS
jgi:acyl-coenzyme A thioesterase PaaI-like protein